MRPLLPYWTGYQAFKPVTDEQVFYDKFLCDKFYSSVRATLTIFSMTISALVQKLAC
jgi:hypothetical protein